MRIIGVTGGIGSGKSTVSKILASFGAQVIDADVLARQIVQKGQKALEEIVNYFGEAVLDSEGNLDRKKLSGIVFKDKKKLEALNRITHNYIAEKIIEEIKKIKEDETVVVDAPIPIEHGFTDVVDEIWTVIADKEVRIKRVMERSGLTYNEVEDRINSQLSDEFYLSISDRVIVNNGSIEELRLQVEKYFFISSI
ncbi:dephospho-CoA kinase [Acetivibrio clariflavus]|uniref:Dephospho-CoA kinase n=1 Tax=Acetivibrio clariflavus (strain DSM 19732 / NBRC 101661 / EBR45) TaxID=720554 RepID=G8M1J5_ACECE|nr:dephospho-CoA kinase [Acetivibrio clariflavus]AEV69210.1 dephospho-CoA kinase [Acetivibrio clariflavus DSM 19732]